MSVAAAEAVWVPALAEPEVAERVRPAAVFWDAREVLDAEGAIQQNAQAIAQSRLETARHEPTLDALGAARLLKAAKESGADQSAIDELFANLVDELRKQVIEVVQPSGHVSITQARVGANGRTHIGGIDLVPLWAKGIHPNNPKWYNRLSQANLVEELLTEQLFNDDALCADWMLLCIQPVPLDEEPRRRALRKRGFRPDTGKWKIRGQEFCRDEAGWLRLSQELTMSGNDIKVLRALFGEFEVPLPPQPGVIGRLGNLALQTLRIPRPWRTRSAETTQMLATCMLVHKSALPRGVIDIGQRADALKGQIRGSHYLCGEPTKVAPSETDYTAIFEASQLREASIDQHVQRLVAIAMGTVDNDAMDFDEQNTSFNTNLVRVLRDLCEQMPQYALHAFGQKAANLYTKAEELRQAGKYDEAELVIDQARQASRMIVFCGAEIELKQGVNFMTHPDQYLVSIYGPNAIMRGFCNGCQYFGMVGKCDGKCGRCVGRARARRR